MKPPATQSSRQVSQWDALPAVSAPMGYLGPGDGPMQVRIYPPSSGLATVRPPSVAHTMSIRDARSITDRLRLDEQGFELHSHRSAFGDFYDEAAVRERTVELQAAARHEAQLGIVGNLELAFLGQVFARLARHCPALRAEPAHCAGIDQPLRGRTRRR